MPSDTHFPSFDLEIGFFADPVESTVAIPDEPTSQQTKVRFTFRPGEIVL